MRTRRIGSSRSYCCCKCCCFTVRSCGSNSVESGYRHCVFIFFFLCLTKFGDGVTTERFILALWRVNFRKNLGFFSVTKWSKDLSSKLRILFDESTKYEEIIRVTQSNITLPFMLIALFSRTKAWRKRKYSTHVWKCGRWSAESRITYGKGRKWRG